MPKASGYNLNIVNYTFSKKGIKDFANDLLELAEAME